MRHTGHPCPGGARRASCTPPFGCAFANASYRPRSAGREALLQAQAKAIGIGIGKGKARLQIKVELMPLQDEPSRAQQSKNQSEAKAKRPGRAAPARDKRTDRKSVV